MRKSARCLVVRDELMGLVAGLNQYKGGKGADRQFYLSLWSGEAIIIDRKSDKSQRGAPLYVRDPFAGLIGTIQPDVLERMRGESVRGVSPPDDGFLDRFAVTFPACLPDIGEEWREVSEEALEDWSTVVRKLLGLAMVAQDDGGMRPFFVRLTDSGRAAWEAFTRACRRGERRNIPRVPQRAVVQTPRLLWSLGADHPFPTPGLR